MNLESLKIYDIVKTHYFKDTYKNIKLDFIYGGFYYVLQIFIESIIYHTSY